MKIQIRTTRYVTLRDMQRKYKTIGSLTIISPCVTFTNTLTQQMLIVGSKHSNATLSRKSCGVNDVNLKKA